LEDNSFWIIPSETAKKSAIGESSRRIREKKKNTKGTGRSKGNEFGKLHNDRRLGKGEGRLAGIEREGDCKNRKL